MSLLLDRPAAAPADRGDREEAPIGPQMGMGGEASELIRQLGLDFKLTLGQMAFRRAERAGRNLVQPEDVEVCVAAAAKSVAEGFPDAD